MVLWGQKDQIKDYKSSGRCSVAWSRSQLEIRSKMYYSGLSSKPSVQFWVHFDPSITFWKFKSIVNLALAMCEHSYHWIWRWSSLLTKILIFKWIHKLSLDLMSFHLISMENLKYVIVTRAEVVQLLTGWGSKPLIS